MQDVAESEWQARRAVSRLSRAERGRVFRRRRRVALAGMAVLIVFFVWATASLFGGGDSGSAEQVKPKLLPGGGRLILPNRRVVAFYGAPQDTELGTLGIGTPDEAGRKLIDQARPYQQPTRPVLPAFELIATIAHSAPGPQGLHRQRQSDAVISRYLAAARRIKALLILDIQPGQADFLDEVQALEPYLAQPDVGLALDSEWSVPPGVVPGQQIGSTDAATINRVSYYLARIVHRDRLPQKLLVVHQFTDGMVTDDLSIRPRPGVAIVSNIDGFGAPDVKAGVYKRLTRPRRVEPRGGGYFNGLKLFFQEDTNLLSPASVLALRPQPDIVVYE
jgi:hypothetical protein